MIEDFLLPTFYVSLTMANTFININLHVIFAAKHRESIIPLTSMDNIHNYIAKSINSRGHRTINIGGTPNHVHVLFSYNGKEPIANIIRDIKVFSTKYINNNRITKCHFEWQKGYACFSVSPRDVELISNYIDRQVEHHHGKSVVDELRMILDKAAMEYDERFLFDDV